MANEGSGTLSVYHIDPMSGALGAAGPITTGSMPNGVVAVRIVQ